MTTISDRYARAADAFAATVAAVPDDRWPAPTPCEGWTARDVVAHVIEAHGLFLGMVGRELGEVPPVADDPAAAFATARAVVAADLADPDRAGATFEGFFGETTFAESIDRFLTGDLVVHRWDLARATGGDERIDPDEVERVHAESRGFGDAMRSPGTFGPALDPPEGADAQTELLAFLGRRAW